jgi:hypothetical protein
MKKKRKYIKPELKVRDILLHAGRPLKIAEIKDEFFRERTDPPQSAYIYMHNMVRRLCEKTYKDEELDYMVVKTRSRGSVACYVWIEKKQKS